MKITLEFNLPDDEYEAKAAFTGSKMLPAIERFRNRLRSVVKHDDSVSISALYSEYCEEFNEFME